ncbi:hypothetical protein [Pseudoalteromonas sp. S16_S37]|uniref:hypothetical protein n=1 Tax=Pseudoalteromonas sp. S16_S37 TaxID=2720228 RepID=UPI0016801941|nr:hypothetical protein [Pseudoalteromonas sp. S16_S37]MBD1582580.1 hypothetical protein [Pseudoalteromonas sp. S16_S37]
MIFLTLFSLILISTNIVAAEYQCLGSSVRFSNGEVATKFELNGKLHIVLTDNIPSSNNFTVDGTEYFVFEEHFVDDSYYWVGFTRTHNLVKSGLFTGKYDKNPLIKGDFVKLFSFSKQIYVISEDSKSGKTIVAVVNNDFSGIKSIFETDGRPTDTFLDTKTRALNEQGYSFYQVISGYPNWAVAITPDSKVHPMHCLKNESKDIKPLIEF